MNEEHGDSSRVWILLALWAVAGAGFHYSIMASNGRLVLVFAVVIAVLIRMSRRYLRSPGSQRADPETGEEAPTAAAGPLPRAHAPSFRRIRPLPESWRGILERNVRFYGRLPPDLRERLDQLVQLFVEDVPFEGWGGLEIDDEVRLTVSAQACLLALGNHRLSFPKLRSILVYPGVYEAEARDLPGEHVGPRAGESHGEGYVVLAWSEVLNGAAHDSDGHNVVLHEFAHQLDQADGVADGIPMLEGDEPYRAWSEILEKHFAELLDRVDRNLTTVLDPYGTTNRAEFFAVATEAFFEKPQALDQRKPELYELLEAFYGLDPKAWYRLGSPAVSG